MNKNSSPHSFHIPVMGTGYTIDTPIKVAHYGISSVISIIDHRLIEQMREYNSSLYKVDFSPIDENEEDARAKRITAYLNLVQDIVTERINKLKSSAFEEGTEITKYFEMLSDSNSLKKEYCKMLLLSGAEKEQEQENLRKRIVAGSIDVNIMTKLDRTNKASAKTALPTEYNDAHAALRGFANSKLSSSVVFSAGLNPRLYSYISNFDDFFPDENGEIKKKVVLKVSDYRSALIQGKFLAKKGIWVSEFRVESGLNCGGHAFATDGYLMGPILQEFKDNRQELSNTLFSVYSEALESLGKHSVSIAPKTHITVQGGVGTSGEHEFLLEFYKADSIGWGSPFLFVPEAISIDDTSLDLLIHTGEEDYYLSDVSPLGVPFNTVRGSSAEIEKLKRITADKPGAPCVKKHLTFNTEFTEDPICTASVKYQRKKIDELIAQDLKEREFKAAFEKIITKTCLCVGLGNGALIQKKQTLAKGTQGVAICPGPNAAYFTKKVSLKEMIDHIYGRKNIITTKNRPNMFVKELKLYMNYLKARIEEYTDESNKKQAQYIEKFKANLSEGIAYYENLFEQVKSQFNEFNEAFISELKSLRSELNALDLVVA